MMTVILLFAGALVVVGVILLVLRSGNAGGRHLQSGESVVRAQRQEKARANEVRASGGDD
jgi:hypothetical protein